MAIINYNVDYYTSGCNAFGVFDSANITTDIITTNASTFSKVLAARDGLGNDYTYEVVIPIDGSIFSSNMALPNNTPMDISFERAPSKLSLLKTEEFSISSTFDTVLSLEDAYLIVPYTIYPETNGMDQINRDAQITFDDYVISRFNVPVDSPNVRMPNLLSGGLPSKLFFRLMSLNSYTGNYDSSTTLFQRHKLKKVTVYVDGNVLTGFPISMSENMIAIPYTRFLENTNRYTNPFAGRMITQGEFKAYHFIHSITFDQSLSGAVTFEFEFEETPAEPLVLITCSVHGRTLELDQFRNFRLL